MTYQLRDYQQKASDAAVSFFNNKAKKTNAIMVLPTGSGKSLIIADIAARLDGHTLVFQPSKEKKKKQSIPCQRGCCYSCSQLAGTQYCRSPSFYYFRKYSPSYRCNI